jgi:hypothetical protein
VLAGGSPLIDAEPAYAPTMSGGRRDVEKDLRQQLSRDAQIGE